jgi:5-methyltetrahydrofolate--homocysteine methyltransferase
MEIDDIIWLDDIYELHDQGKDNDAFHLYGLALETAEALAEYSHRQIRLELGIAGEDSPYILELFHGSYRGVRFSFGDAACPNLADLLKLLFQTRREIREDTL